MISTTTLDQVSANSDECPHLMEAVTQVWRKEVKHIFNEIIAGTFDTIMRTKDPYCMPVPSVVVPSRTEEVEVRDFPCTGGRRHS